MLCRGLSPFDMGQVGRETPQRQWPILHRVLRELKSRFRNFLGSIFMSVSESWQPTHSHHNDRVPAIQIDSGRRVGNLHMKFEAHAHGVDGRLVRWIATRGHTHRHFRSDLRHSKRATRDGALTDCCEHTVRQCEAEERFRGLVHVFPYTSVSLLNASRST